MKQRGRGRAVRLRGDVRALEPSDTQQRDPNNCLNIRNRQIREPKLRML
jgi:hypothetical protein